MTAAADRGIRQAIGYGALVVAAWFAYVWLGLRLIHVWHEAMVASLGLVAALAAEAAVASVAAWLLVALLRAGFGDWRRAVSVILWMTLIVVGHYVAFIENMSAREFLTRTGMGEGFAGLAAISGLYAILLAIPFIPGIEIGLLIIALYGPWGAVAVFATTNLALQAGFLAGCVSRALPFGPARLARLLTADGDVADAASQGLAARLARLWPRIGRYRYVLLGLLLNLPGNAAVGGGGGIVFLSGLSGRFAWRWYALTLLIATCPVPVLAALGVLSMESLK